MTPTLDALHMAFSELLAPVAPSRSTSAPAEPAPAAPASPAEGGAAVPAPVAAPLPVPCEIVDPKKKGWHLDVRVTPDQLLEAARLVDQAGFAIDAVTGVDWLAAGQMEVVYDFFHPTQCLHVVLRTRVPRGEPVVPTISEVFPGANWHERETHDFFGIVFSGHPDLSPLLLPEDADYHPLRKDFAGVP